MGKVVGDIRQLACTVTTASTGIDPAPRLNGRAKLTCCDAGLASSSYATSSSGSDTGCKTPLKSSQRSESRASSTNTSSTSCTCGMRSKRRGEGRSLSDATIMLLHCYTTPVAATHSYAETLEPILNPVSVEPAAPPSLGKSKAHGTSSTAAGMAF